MGMHGYMCSSQPSLAASPVAFRRRRRFVGLVNLPHQYPTEFNQLGYIQLGQLTCNMLTAFGAVDSWNGRFDWTDRFYCTKLLD